MDGIRTHANDFRDRCSTTKLPKVNCFIKDYFKIRNQPYIFEVLQSTKRFTDCPNSDAWHYIVLSVYVFDHAQIDKISSNLTRVINPVS